MATFERLTRRQLLVSLVTLASCGRGSRDGVTVGTPADRQHPLHKTLQDVLDVLIPNGEYPGHQTTGVLATLERELGVPDGKPERLLLEFIDHLEAGATRRGAPSFSASSPIAREEVLRELDRVNDAQFRFVRARALILHYSHPASWPALRFSHAPQPQGYADFSEPPAVA